MKKFFSFFCLVIILLIPAVKVIGLSDIPDWTATCDQADARFGRSVSGAGDVNGDGYEDVIVGAYMYGSAFGDGKVFVYHGSGSGLSDSADWTAESDMEGANFGRSVSGAGDVNGDGYSDVIVGAYYYGSLFGDGKVFVYHGSDSGLSDSADWTAEPDQEDTKFGYSVSSAGDVNGDGFSDVIVGAYLYDNGQENEGVAFVYHGSDSGLSETPNWIGESDQEGAHFGVSVSGAGDANGDGYDDVIVGADFYERSGIPVGGAFVYHGDSSGLSPIRDWLGTSNVGFSYFGRCVSGTGNVKGDGYSGVIIGAYRYPNGEEDEGMAFVGYGSSSGLPSSANWRGQSNQEFAHFGGSVSGAGDVNGDGYSDIIVGAYDYDNGEENEGMAFVYYGDSTGLSATEDWTAESNQTGGGLGISVSGAGDVNGDGYDDVIVGGNRFAYVYHGDSPSGMKEYISSNTSTKLSISPFISTNIFSIRFSLSEEEAEDNISLKVYNKAGIMVKNLFQGKKSAGTHTITLNGNKLPNDIYFVSLKKGSEENIVKKIVLIR